MSMTHLWTWPKVQKFVIRYFTELRWYSIVLALVFYSLSSWSLLRLAGETALTQSTDYIYWLAVTGSTVGYGDLSPVTAAGKYLVAFYIIPFGLTIFALVLGRAAAWVSAQWHKGVKGLRDLSVSEHILVIGWNEKRTLHLLNLLLQERNESADKPDIVLCVRADIDNPMPGKVEFVKVSSFNNNQDMDRACISEAKIIIMDNPEDDLTMTTALYCSKRNPNGHKIAYFKDESLVQLLQQHCPNVECTPSVAVEMLAKSAFDPGSSKLHHDLLSVEDGQAQYSAAVPLNISAIPVTEIFIKLKQHYDAIFIGYAAATEPQQVIVNPPLTTHLGAGDKIYYIAEQRINQIDWQQLGGH